jgi:prepilin-type processing-associated H-X9-DG protein
VNLPAGRHGQGGVLSFADGHADSWHCQEPKRFAPKQSYWKLVESRKDLSDLRRLQTATLPKSEFVPQTGYNPVQP